MACWTVWKCDGCDTELKLGEHKSDWKRITVTVDGFGGYPVGADANGEHEYELCPACQKRLVEVIRPGRWARDLPEPPATIGDGALPL